MQPLQLDSKDGLVNGWAGLGAGNGNVPQRSASASNPSKSMGANASDNVEETTSRRGWMNATFRFMRNAAVGLLLVTAIPVGVVALRSRFLTYFERSERTIERIQRAQYLRPLMLPKDASITPMQAGSAFHAIQLVKTDEQFPTVPSGSTAMRERPWRTHKLTDDMFKSAGFRSPAFQGPSPDHIIEAVNEGLSAIEVAWLRDVAEAPLWKNFDIVAAAKAVDFLGGQYQLPFRAEAYAPLRPLLGYGGTKELASAGISRAAYYVAIGQPDKADAALRSVVSFGFAMIDNATTEMDALTGQMIVNMGRRGFEQFNYSLPGLHDMVELHAPPPSTESGAALMGMRISAAGLHERLLKGAMDHSAPRGVRLQRLTDLSYASCKNIPEMINGPGADTPRRI